MTPIKEFTLDRYVPEEEELLEYVQQVALKYYPDIDINENGEPYICGTQALYKFQYRYNNNSLNIRFDYNSYIGSTFKNTVQALGIDLDKF